jgi:hypothetical protein
VFRVLILLTFVFSLALALAAQSGGRGSNPPGTGSVPNKPPAPNPNLTSPDMTSRSFFLSGQVRVDDGTLLTDAAAIQSICRAESVPKVIPIPRGISASKLAA